MVLFRPPPFAGQAVVIVRFWLWRQSPKCKTRLGLASRQTSQGVGPSNVSTPQGSAEGDYQGDRNCEEVECVSSPSLPRTSRLRSMVLRIRICLSRHRSVRYQPSSPCRTSSIPLSAKPCSRPPDLCSCWLVPARGKPASSPIASPN